MTLTVTPLYAALLTAIYILLTVRVSLRRGAVQANFGDGGDEELRLRIRAHGNFSEFVPLGLLLLVMAELNAAPGWALNLAGLLLVAGRAGHALALSGIGGLPLRAGGMLMTLAALIIASLLALL